MLLIENEMAGMVSVCSHWWICTDMHHLTTGIHSEKCIIRWFRHCANMYLHKPR